jgi:hypothetical protein
LVMTSPIEQADDQAYRAWRDKLGLSMKTPRPREIVELIDRMERFQYGAVDGPASRQKAVFDDAQ